MKIVVTGGAGFIGSHLVDRLLVAGHQVDVLDNLATGSLRNIAEAQAAFPEQVQFVEWDVRSPETVDRLIQRRPDVVYHLAAQADVRVSVERPAFDALVNVVGSLNVFEGALKGGARKVIFAASGGTLYGLPDTIPTPESAPQRPISPYGVAKKAAGDYLYYYQQVHDLEYGMLALANVYGPRQDPYGEAGVVAIFGNLFLNGEVPVIYGDGGQTRDFVYVGDVAEAFVLAMTAGSNFLANVGTGNETTVNTLFNTMARLCRFSGTPTYAPARAGELRRSALNTDLFSSMGWKAATDLSEGLSLTLDWLRSPR